MKFDTEKFRKSMRTKRLIDREIDCRVAAKEIGISAATVSRIENGKLPDVESFGKCCAWLNISADQFFIKPKTPLSKWKI